MIFKSINWKARYIDNITGKTVAYLNESEEWAVVGNMSDGAGMLQLEEIDGMTLELNEGERIK